MKINGDMPWECEGGVVVVELGEAKYFELLSFYHWIISDPDQSPSDIIADVVCRCYLTVLSTINDKLDE